MGGSPTLSDLSTIADEMEHTDKRKWFAVCHHCDGHVALDGDAWPLVKWSEDETRAHPIYGKAVPESAYMVCPHCGGIWTDAERARNSREAEMRGGGFKPTAQFTGIAGFYISDLMSSAPGASLPRLVEKYLEAVHREAAGDITGKIEFTNNQLGLAFKYKSPAPKVEELEARSEDYPELTVPWGGLRLTIGRGRAGRSHRPCRRRVGPRRRIVAGVLGRDPRQRVRSHRPGVDRARGVDLPALPARERRRALHRVDSIDSSDGNTSDAVYEFCAEAAQPRRGGDPRPRDRRDLPRAAPIDPGRKTKAARYGLHVYNVGTEKAKDLLIGFGEHGGRLRLSEQSPDGRVVTGRGPGRMHWYRGIRGDYFAQVTSEIKAPLKGQPRNKIYWQRKSGVRNEALDCEVYALHAARRIKINLMTEAQWSAIEEKLRQPDLVTAAQAAAPQQTDTPVDERAAPADAAPGNKNIKPGAAAPRPERSTGNINPLLAQLTPATGGGGSDIERPY
jgi:phage terminase large subunit GpA-like protein